jgi:hypothetical protein
MRTRQDVIDAFTFQQPTGDTRPRYEAITAACRELALVLFDNVPECPERTLALRHIQEGRMMANAGIALFTRPKEESR